MPTREALRRCPEAIVVHPRIAHYGAVSKQIFAVFHEFTPLVQGLSLDEAFLDVTASESALGNAEHIAREIKRRISERTELTASVGRGTQQAGRQDRIRPAQAGRPRPGERSRRARACSTRCPFVNCSASARRRRRRSKRWASTPWVTCARPIRRACGPLFGRYTERLQQRAAGIDDRPVIPDVDKKQISAEETFDTDIADPARLQAEIVRLADKTAHGCARKSCWAGA